MSEVLKSLYKEDGKTVVENFADPNDSGKFNTSPVDKEIKADENSINSNLGGGMQAAGNMQYSWDKQAEERAGMEYTSKILETKNQFLTNRQQIEAQGQSYQEQVAMNKYAQNQSADKVGWTGGYVLDTERQMNYLKESIKAQMYGQMELQKYGYDTSLAAARLAYDTQKYDLALQYYQQAIQNAVTEASQTELYISPEVREHRNNYKIAADTLNDPNASQEDKEKAAKLITSINDWFKDYGISPAGVKTIARLDFEHQTDLDRQASIKAMYELYKIDPSNNFKIDIDSFGRIDSTGSIVNTKNDNGELVPDIVDFNTMSPEKLLEYATIHEKTKQQVYGYFEGKVIQDINKYLDTVKQTTGTGENAKTTYNVNANDLKKYLEIHGFKDIMEVYEKAKGSDNYKDILKDWEKEFDAQGTAVYVSIDEDGDIVVNIGNKDNGSLIDTKEGPREIGPDGYVMGDKWLYKDDGTTVVGYNPTDIETLYKNLKEDGYSFKTKRVIDLDKDQSEWAKELDQNDFSATKSTGKAGEYINQIIQDMKNGKIRIGDIVQFNYGEASNDTNYTYVYLGDHKFAKCTAPISLDANNNLDTEAKDTKETLKRLYIPTGYDYRMDRKGVLFWKDKWLEIYKK